MTNKTLIDEFEPRTRDAGFTFVEVVWALLLLGLIAMGSLGIFLQGMKSVSHNQRQQTAVALANSAMDAARSVSGGSTNPTGTSGLVRGRSESAVKSAWNAATTRQASDTADMTWSWDPKTGLTAADQWVPITTTQTVNNQPYTITTLIGTCYRLRAASTLSQNCQATDPGGTSHVRMFRVRIVVNWDEGDNGSSGAYSYRLSTLVDPSPDATWNTVLLPFAYDDEFSIPAGGSTEFFATVTNDTVDYNTSGSVNPIFALTNPSPTGYGALVSESVNPVLNGVNFTSPLNHSGLFTFTYKVESSAGQESLEPGTVTMHVLPRPVSDTGTNKIYVPAGVNTNITDMITANDAGVANISASRKTTVIPAYSNTVDMFSTEDVSQAVLDARAADAAALSSRGLTTSGDQVWFRNDTAGQDRTFYYYLADDPVGSGTRYPNTTYASFTVSTADPPMYTTSPPAVPFNAVNTTPVPSNTVDWRALTGNRSDVRIRVTNVTGPAPTPGNAVKVDGTSWTSGNLTGNNLTFSPGNKIGTYTVTYRTVASSGTQSSTTGILTFVVHPVGYNIPTTNGATTNFVQITRVGTGSSNDRTYAINPDHATNAAYDFVPTTNVGIRILDRIGGVGCPNSWTRPANEPLQIRLTFTSNSSSSYCDYSYKVVSTALSPVVESQTTYTLRIVRGNNS